MATIKIEIINWEIFNEKRKDVKNPSWLRLENRMPASQRLFGLTAEEKWVRVSILCLVNQKQSPEHEIDLEWFRWYTGASADAIVSCIKKLHNKTLRVRDEHVTDTARTRNEHVTCADNQPPRLNVTDGRTDGRTDGAYPKNISDEVIEILQRGNIPPPAVQTWLKKYGGDVGWLSDQISDAAVWADSAPRHKKPAQPAVFFNRWLKREWKEKQAAMPKQREKQDVTKLD